jgi:outer membrane protein TolC
MTFEEWNAEPYSRTFEDAWKAGAASRDAEIDDLGESLAQVKLKNAMLIKERDQLRDQVQMLRGERIGAWRRSEALREQVKMLHSYLKRWAFTTTDDECAHMEVQEALAATEPKS